MTALTRKINEVKESLSGGEGGGAKRKPSLCLQERSLCTAIGAQYGPAPTTRHAPSIQE